MKPSAQLVAQFSARFVKAVLLGSIVLTLSLSSGGPAGVMGNDPVAPSRGPIYGSQNNSTAPPTVPGFRDVQLERGIERDALSFDGDRRLEVAIAVDDIRPAYAHYTIRLQLPSGAEQSIAVSAPPGGLRPEVRDMTGDNVRNDLILAPALLQWPLTVLVNDGHDHFVLAVSAAPPDSLSSKEAQASKGDNQTTEALRSAGFKTGAPSSDGRLSVPQSQQATLGPGAQAEPKRLCHSSSSGRAPPMLVTEI